MLVDQSPINGYWRGRLLPVTRRGGRQALRRAGEEEDGRIAVTAKCGPCSMAVLVLFSLVASVLVILLLAHGLPLSAHAALQLTNRMQTPRDTAIRTIEGTSGAIAPPLPRRVAQSLVRPPRRGAFRAS